jgi:hypothetical protein
MADKLFIEFLNKKPVNFKRKIIIFIEWPTLLKPHY